MPKLWTLLSASALALLAGLSFVAQQAVNANLRASLQSAAWAGFVSYLGGTVCMLVLALVLRDAVPQPGLMLRSHWWAWTGGMFGAIYIGISILLIPRIGTAAFVVLLVAGQMLASLVFDQYGLLGVPQHPANAPRLVGALFLVAGAILVRY